jgi:dTDP-4-dehydrorhamnose 3,5-epimerase-like enzyme
MTESAPTIAPGVQLGPGVQLADAVRLEAGARLAPEDEYGTFMPAPGEPRLIVGGGAIVGRNALVLAGSHVGVGAEVAPDAVVTRPVPAFARVAGTPARVVGFCGARVVVPPAHGTLPTLRAGGAALRRLPLHRDQRGTLSFGQLGDHLPFSPQRYFIITDVPDGFVRGDHAHREQHQFFVPVRGRCRVVVDDGREREEILLGAPTIGLHVPPLAWGTLYDFSADALLLVLTSGRYDAAEYVRSYEAFAALVAT